MTTPTIRNILIPTDFSTPASLAFAHALRLSLALKADLDIFHVEPENDTADWHWAPKVIRTLTSWGFLKEGATVADLEALGIRARATLAAGEPAEEAILREMAETHADLIVMATHGRSGLSRLLQPSVSKPVALRAPVPVLLLPAGSKGFVDPEFGAGGLSRVLIPVDTVPNPAPGFDAATLLARALPGATLELATFHVGSGHADLELMRPAPGWAVHHWRADGQVVDSILQTAFTWSADLVVVVTEGRRSVFDMLRGSTVERILAGIHRPVLVVPAEWGS